MNQHDTDTALPLLSTPPSITPKWATRVATLARCLLVILLSLAMRVAAEPTTEVGVDEPSTLTVDDVVPFFADGFILEDGGAGGLHEVLDAEANTLGMVCTTLPKSKDIVGYRGPANVLIALDDTSVVVAAKLLSSEDTPEHITAIERDEFFFSQFHGWTLGDPATFTEIDATSGATLTSLAIAESVALRLGSEKPSLRFPDPFDDEDLTFVFGNSEGVALEIITSAEADVVNVKTGAIVAKLFRTGTLVDSINGYQGPGEVLVVTDVDETVLQMRLRRTFDNMPYAGYLNEEDYFWSVFKNKEFADLRGFDVEAEQVEGVSGATMTSMAIADTIVAAAGELHKRRQKSVDDSNRDHIRWRTHDIGTIVVLIVALAIGNTKLRGSRELNIAWMLLLIGYFGLVTGNLISMAVLFGWASKGFAWQLAPGLFAVMAVSLMTPPLTKRNIYCTHVCPHGAVQQLLRRLKLPRCKLTKNTRAVLRRVPGFLLVVAIVCSFTGYVVNLAAWEPFNAWIWYVAGWSSLILAAVSLTISVFLPMAWCRYGCATGQILEYLRHSARATRFSLADGAMIVLVVFAWCWIVFKNSDTGQAFLQQFA